MVLLQTSIVDTALLAVQQNFPQVEVSVPLYWHTSPFGNRFCLLHVQIGCEKLLRSRFCAKSVHKDMQAPVYFMSFLTSSRTGTSGGANNLLNPALLLDKPCSTLTLLLAPFCQASKYSQQPLHLLCTCLVMSPGPR